MMKIEMQIVPRPWINVSKNNKKILTKYIEIVVEKGFALEKQKELNSH